MILDRDAEKIHQLNSTASFVWNRLDSASDVAESSPKWAATSWSHAYTATCPGGTLPSIASVLRMAASQSCVSTGRPWTVNAGPASRIPCASGRSSWGSVCSRRPRSSRTSVSAAV